MTTTTRTLCDQCETELTSTDWQAGYCTQCGYGLRGNKQEARTMSEEYEDYCDNEDCEHDDADHEFMVKHELSAEDFDFQYQQLLTSNKDFGTLAMDELQAHVKADIEAGCWD